MKQGSNNNPSRPNFPNTGQHIAIAGMTGSGKSVAALDMLSRRVKRKFPWLIVDHKRDSEIKKLPAEKLNITTRFLPTDGLFVVQPSLRGADRQDLDDLLERIFKRGKFGVYIDEGHLMGLSDGVRMIMVAGRSKEVPMMWCSQRAASIDPFIWSQSTFYRTFRLQTGLDVKRFNENYPVKFTDPGLHQSHYFDGTTAKTWLLAPSAPIEETVERFENSLLKSYRKV